MRRPLTVSTECPTCAAPLDFREGVNAVRCGYCRNNLLVTGRGRVLSYFVPPRVSVQAGADRAIRDAFSHGERLRLAGAETAFLPYYRVTGHDLRWEKGVREDAARRPFDVYVADGSGLATLGPRLGEVGRRTLPVAPELHDRYVDKSFPAVQVGGLPAYSLGVRLAVLPLRLFEPSVVRGVGRVVAPQVPVEEAERQAAETVALRSQILARRVLGRRLNVIYFPFVFVRLEGRDTARLAIVDGITGKLLARAAAPGLADALHHAAPWEAETVGFRPLVCPNCGWDLPLRPDDAVFYCRTCERAFALVGREMHPVTHALAGECANGRYLPFWRLADPATGGAPSRFLVPGFRFPRLRRLVDLARDLTAAAREAPPPAERPGELLGCFYGSEDARRLAEIAWPRLAPKPEAVIARLAGEGLRYRSETLVWLAFRREGRTLRDPFAGRAIQERFLD